MKFIAGKWKMSLNSWCTFWIYFVILIESSVFFQDCTNGMSAEGGEYEKTVINRWYNEYGCLCFILVTGSYVLDWVLSGS